MSEYRVPALRIRQGEERQLYSLAIEGKQISKIAAISRIRRGEENLVGYQRPEVRNHIREIQRYIESKNPMIPNPVIIAFDKRVRFEPLTDNGDMGHLVIPFSEDKDFEKPGFIVDGQQRTAALRDAEIDSFMMQKNNASSLCWLTPQNRCPKRCYTNWHRIPTVVCHPICKCVSFLRC